VGDALTDLQAAKAAGVRGVLVRTGRGAAEEWLLMKQIGPRWPVVADFAAAVQLILDRAGLFKA
jgi:D-glycero-D-manno-heptose 1,7-bisphosphate phosphatase